MKTRIWSIFLIFSILAGSQLAMAEEKAEEVILKGYFFERPDNTYLHVEMVGVFMVFKLLDENHQEIENVFTRGIMTVNPRGKSKERMAIRPSGDGKSLKSVRTIRKPHILKVNVRLYKGEDDDSSETFNILYNQHTVDEVAVVPEKEK